MVEYQLMPFASFNPPITTHVFPVSIEYLKTLVEMAKKDLAGEKRFAPYWNVYIGGNPLSDAGKAQLEELAKLGVRVKNE